jgi:tRNA A-37 threonylcarbamoyl transferase component Bud32
VDAVCDRFEKAWRAGQRPPIEGYLGELPEPARPALFGELLLLDLHYRRRQLETPTEAEYGRRFPDYTDRIRAAFREEAALRERRSAGADPSSARSAPATRLDGYEAARPTDIADGPSRAETPGTAATGIAGRRLEDYELVRELGSGAMGTVYLAYYHRLQIEVALKVPRPQVVAHPAYRARFFREAQAAARLRHPNLCRVLDAGQCGETLYLAMDYVPGVPLSQAPPRDQRAAAGLVRTLAGALAEAHRLGVVHRDLKPANILITPEGEPVVTDFGLAQWLGADDDARLTQAGVFFGTAHYAAPEQARGQRDLVGPPCDVYSLGVILYQLLIGRVPFPGRGVLEVLRKVTEEEAAPPRALRADIDPRLEAVCLKAMAKRIEDRFGGMEEMAAALAAYLDGAGPGPAAAPTVPAPPSLSGQRPPVPRESLRFAFVGLGERAPEMAGPQDRLYLDVGNGLRPGVIDRHHRAGAGGSTAALVLAHPELLDGAVTRHRRAGDPFTLVLHENPDLDAVTAAYLAVGYLAAGAFPPGAEVLARYADRVDTGAVGMSLANPFSLYAAYGQLAHRLLRRPWNNNHERWREGVRQGLELIGHVLGRVSGEGVALPAVDAFACPGLFTEEDRQEVQADVERYRRKLADPRCRARRALLRLPGQFGGTVAAEALLVRDVQNADDPDRCVYFKDWARTDTANCPGGRGFVALSVFLSEGARQVRRCMLSVAPDGGATLEGLAALLDRAEAERRQELFGADDRVTDPATGEPRRPRPGYANADPWYDGRAHGFTILDAPRVGTLLTADGAGRSGREGRGRPGGT